MTIIAPYLFGFRIGVVTACAVGIGGRFRTDVSRARGVHAHTRTQAAIRRAALPRRHASQ